MRDDEREAAQEALSRDALKCRHVWELVAKTWEDGTKLLRCKVPGCGATKRAEQRRRGGLRNGR